MTERWQDQLVVFVFWFIRSPFLWYAIFGAIALGLLVVMVGCSGMRPPAEDIPIPL